MKERIVRLRKHLGYSQQEFADKLNIKRGTIANYECGRNEPIDAVINLICREFDVSEKWLRDGDGEMFVCLNREQEIAKLTVNLFKESPDSFKNKFISLLARMSDDEWRLLEALVDKLEKKE